MWNPDSLWWRCLLQVCSRRSKHTRINRVEITEGYRRPRSTSGVDDCRSGEPGEDSWRGGLPHLHSCWEGCACRGGCQQQPLGSCLWCSQAKAIVAPYHFFSFYEMACDSKFEFSFFLVLFLRYSWYCSGL